MATVQKRGNSYRITVSSGYDLSGKQLRHCITWLPAPGMTQKQVEKELERQKVLFEERCRTGQLLDGSIRFADFADRWLKDYAEKQLRKKTLAEYKRLLPRINMAIGHIRLDALRPDHLLSFYENLSEKGIRADSKYRCTIDFKKYLSDSNMTKTRLSELAKVGISTLDSITKGKNINRKSAQLICTALNVPFEKLFVQTDKTVATLSNNTILHYHRLISSILGVAVQWQVLFSNPCERVKPPRVEPPEPRYMDEKDAAKLLELIENEDMQYKTMIKLLLYTGFRRGELCGLEWDDIDFERKMITIRRSSLYIPGEGIFEDETKNYSSARSIKVPAIAFEMLSDFKKWQTELRLKAGDKWHDTNRLFTQWDGLPIHPDSITKWFRSFIKQSGLPNISIHSLRHTNATLQIAGGVPISTVSSRLGHSNTSTTGKIYVHAIRSADEAAAETLENILAPNTNNQRRIG